MWAHWGVTAVARDHRVSTSQIAVAWLLALSPILVPILGATRPEHVVRAWDATRLALSAAELERVGG